VEHRFVIDVGDVPQHEGTWVFPVPREWCADALRDADAQPADEEGRLEVEVTHAGSDFLVRGSVQVRLDATCVRCLRPTPIAIDAPISVLYVAGPIVEAARTEEDEDDEPAPDEGPDVEHYQGTKLILDPYVRDTILLEIPMNPKCQVVDCRLPERPHGDS
jgi:uncharacterized protein